MRFLLGVLVLAACADEIDTGRDRDARAPIGGDSGVAPDAGPPSPAPIPCTYLSDTHGMGAMRLDVPTDSPERLTFSVRGVPDPALVVGASLTFDTYDADHPGEEGLIWVNDMGPFDVPADPALQEMPSTASVDVSGTTVAGDNTVVFGPGTLVPGTFFEISDVALALEVRATTCP